MFKYSYKNNNTECYVSLPSEICFSHDFQIEISHLISICFFEHDNAVEKLYVACKEGMQYDKMSIAYLYNVLRYLSNRMEVKWNTHLRKIVEPNVQFLSGKSFVPINIEDKILKNDTQYYVFAGDKDVEKAVNEIASILVEMNCTFEKSSVKEFLSTTIGEIFSNCINHSEENQIFLAYDINYDDESNFYLVVNVIDYGKTIVENVKEYLACEKRAEKTIYDDPVECMKWAVRSGNTTRKGSGGYGLPTLINYVKSANGELCIMSGKADLYINRGIEDVKEPNGIFTGTSVSFKVNLFDTHRIYAVNEERREIISISLDEL